MKTPQVIVTILLMSGGFCALKAQAPTPATAPRSRPEIPTLIATTAKNGVAISEKKGPGASRTGDSSLANSMQNPSGMTGARTDFETSERTERNLAVKIQLRSSREPAHPYDVECFFFSKGKSGPIQLHDACKTQSSKVFDELTLTSKPLFGGEKQAAKVTQYWTDQRTYVSLTSVAETRGKRFVGWIVRIKSEGQIVRTEASLPELKEYARKEATLLDTTAAALTFLPR